MACNSVATTVTNVNNVSGGDRRFETGSGILLRGYSESSSSPDAFRKEQETAPSAVCGEDLRNSRIIQTGVCTAVTPPSADFAGDRRCISVRHSWYPQTTGCYVAAATEYPLATGSRPQTTWSAVTWPEMAAVDDVKPTSFVLPPTPSEYGSNYVQSYCTER